MFFFFYTREGKEITPSSWEVTARLSSILISLSIRISKVAKWEREIMIFNLLFPHIVGSVRKIYSEETSELGISYSKLMSRRKLNIRYIFCSAISFSCVDHERTIRSMQREPCNDECVSVFICINTHVRPDNILYPQQPTRKWNDTT